MNTSSEEKVMYQIMNALNNSGIPISFKGSMVLRACLLEAGYSEDIRHTSDIDANWFSDDQPTEEQIIQSMQKVVQQNGLNLDITLFRKYGEGRSAGFTFIDRDSGEILFTMDMDVNRHLPSIKVYEIGEIRFRGVIPTQMLADKVSVVSTNKVFRRIKDVIDLYYLSKAFDFHREDVLEIMQKSGRTLGDFHGFLHRTDDLKHSYDKFRLSGDVAKPAFEEVYDTVHTYIHSMLPNEET